MPQMAPMPSSPKAPMQSKMLMTVIGAVVIFALGLVVGKALGGGKQFEAGKMAAKQELNTALSQSGLLPPEFPTYALAGTVKAVGGDSFTLETQQTVRNPLAEPAPLQRKVMIGASTKIVQLVQRPAEDYQKELDKFNKDYQAFIEEINKGKTGLTPPQQPSPIDRKELALADLKEGMNVSVTSATDILRAASFEATEVSVLPENSAAGPAPLGAGFAAPPPPAPIPPPAAIAPPPAAAPIAPPPATEVPFAAPPPPAPIPAP